MRYVSIAIQLICALVVIVGTFLFLKHMPDSPEGGAIQSSRVQCAHWSILRSSQLLGVSLSMDYLKKKLPYRKQGHSMLQMSNVLKEIGSFGYLTTAKRSNTLTTIRTAWFAGMTSCSSTTAGRLR